MTRAPNNVLAHADVAKGPIAAHCSGVPRPPEWSGLCASSAREERGAHQGTPSEVWFESHGAPDTASGNFSIVISALEATGAEQIAVRRWCVCICD